MLRGGIWPRDIELLWEEGKTTHDEETLALVRRRKDI